MTDANRQHERWRLILGRYAERSLPDALDDTDQRRERALDFLYSREYVGRGIRGKPSAERKEGTLDSSVVAVVDWLGEVRELFPKETAETIEKHALDRYQLTELLADPETLRRLEPSFELLKLVLALKGRMRGAVLDEARRLIRKVVDELTRKLAREIQFALSGRLNRFRRSHVKTARNFDWRGTIRRNLKHYSPEHAKLIVEELRFHSRLRRSMPWTVVLCVDQSGSMTASLIHATVMAGILAGLPMLRVKLVVFDTSIVDLTDQVDDPVEVLLSVQLGGGTDIGQAMEYCEQQVVGERRSIVVLVSDFYEGAEPTKLVRCVKRLREAGVQLLGLASLDDESGEPTYDRQMAQRLADVGMEIAALSPRSLAEWLAARIS